MPVAVEEMLPQFDLLIGTEEEFLIAGGVPGDLIASLQRVRAVTPAAMVVKLGAKGCAHVPDAVPARVRLRDHGRLSELLPGSERRPAREPQRTPVRTGH